LFESAVVENDIAKSIQRFQFALQQAKQKLDFAVAKNCWLLPSKLLLNMSNIVGYNNKLQKATDNMRLGVNNINNEIIPSVKHNLGPAKKNLLPQEEKKKEIPPPTETVKITSEKHEDNKVVLIIAVAGLTWLLFK